MPEPYICCDIMLQVTEKPIQTSLNSNIRRPSTFRQGVTQKLSDVIRICFSLFPLCLLWC